MDSQAISEQMQSLLERIRRLEDADNGGWISAVEEKKDFFFGGRSYLHPGHSRRLFLEVLQRAESEAAAGRWGDIKYFIVTGVAYSSPGTTLKLYGGTDYDLANSAIIEPYFSMAKAPYGFPLDEAKWRVEGLVTADSSQASPAAGTLV